MTLAVRVIPCLDVDAGRVVKGVNFRELRDAGDPVELARLYDAEGADELTFLDISASHEGRATTLDIVSRTAEQVFIPLTVGGGVSTRRRRRPAAARRRRQDRGEHRRHPTAPSWSPRSPTGSATRCWCSRSTPAAARDTDVGLRGDHARRPHERRPRRRRVGPPCRRPRRRRDPAQRDGRRRHHRRLRPRADPAGPRPRSRSRSSPAAGRAPSSTSRPPSTPAPTPSSPPRSSTSAPSASPT